MQPTIPVHAIQRGLIAKLSLDILSTYARAYLGTERIGANAHELVIGCAVMVGQAEGKPLTASDIATYIGMPRSTVARYLRTLERIGAIQSMRDGNRVAVWLSRVNSDEVVAHSMALISRTKKACQAIAKMDTAGIDATVGSE